MLSDYDRRVLRAVRDLAPDAYGVTLHEVLGGSLGAIYVALEAMEDAGLVTSRDGPPLPERGGRRKRYWALTIGGAAALREEA